MPVTVRRVRGGYRVTTGPRGHRHVTAKRTTRAKAYRQAALLRTIDARRSRR